MEKKEIAIIRETRQRFFVKKIMDLIAPHLKLRSSDRVAIKINLSGFKEIYANTHYETVDSLIGYLKEQFGISHIAVIEGSDGAFFSGKTTWDIFYKFRYKEVELKGVELVNLDELPHDQVLPVQTISGARDIHYAKVDADYIISVVPPKTHNILPVFLSIPNLIGFIRPEDRVLLFGASVQEMKRINFFQGDGYFHLIRHANENFATLLSKIQPSLVLIDGLYGMEGRGPIKGSPVFHGFSVASEDPVMADALTTFIMGFSPEDLRYLELAQDQGLGVKDWPRVIGVDPLQVKFPYRPHPLFQRQRKRYGPPTGESRRGDRPRGFQNRNGQPNPKTS